MKSNNIHHIKFSVAKLRNMFSYLQEKSVELIDEQLVDILVSILISKKDYSVIVREQLKSV
jgi:hypothetical protein